MNSLLCFISERPSMVPLFQYDQQRFSSTEMINWVHDWRLQNQLICAGKKVALVVGDSSQLIKLLTALDGFCASMTIFSSAINDCDIVSLVDQSGVDVIIRGEKELEILSRSTDKGLVQKETEWVLATSGTTGTPKLMKHNFSSLTATTLKDSAKGKDYIWGLFYDVSRFAGLQVVFQSLISGSLLILSKSESLSDKVKLMEEFSVNAISATPSLWRRILLDPNSRNLCLKRITLGGEIADQSTLEQLKAIYLNAKITHVYASTEAGVGFSVKDGKEGFPAEWLQSHPKLDMKVSKENNCLLIKSMMLASGSEVDKRLDSDGYLDTEDRVEVKGDRVFFLGRASGSINVGGNKVHPEEVENVIRVVQGVSDVRVFGKKSSLVGELVVAEIVVHEKIDSRELKKEVLELCKSKLDAYKVPVLVNFISKLKYNTSGKLVRKPR